MRNREQLCEHLRQRVRAARRDPALPGVLAGLALGFAKALGEFGATITFVSNIPGETRTLALAIFTELDKPGGDAVAMRLAWLSIAISVAALAISEWLSRSAKRGQA